MTAMFSLVCMLFVATSCHSFTPRDGRERLYREELFRKKRGNDRADSEDRKELVRRWLRENEEPLPEPPPPPATPSRDIIVF